MYYVNLSIILSVVLVKIGYGIMVFLRGVGNHTRTSYLKIDASKFLSKEKPNIKERELIHLLKMAKPQRMGEKSLRSV